MDGKRHRKSEEDRRQESDVVLSKRSERVGRGRRYGLEAASKGE